MSVNQFELYVCEICQTQNVERHRCRWCTNETDEQECVENKGRCADCQENYIKEEA